MTMARRPRELAYVALVSRDPLALESLLGDRLGLARSEVASGSDAPLAAYAVGATALVVAPVGHALVDGTSRTGVHHIAIAAPDPAAEADDMRRRGIAVEASRIAPALGGGTRIALDPAPLGGVATWLAPPITRADSRSRAIERIDHIGIASADNRGAVSQWVERMGLPLESQQTDLEVAIAVESFTSDRYGVVYHSRPPQPIAGLRVAFITLGDTELEFLQSFDPRAEGRPAGAVPARGQGAGDTRQDHGAIARYIAARGAGLHHVAFKTPAIDGVLEDLAAAGVALIDRKGRPGSRRARIGFIDPKATGGVLLHFVEREELEVA
jgi:catechol 2,3-dioxygenase-like lactoylglutathione lyase family enzyme